MPRCEGQLLGDHLPGLRGGANYRQLCWLVTTIPGHGSFAPWCKGQLSSLFVGLFSNFKPVPGAIPDVIFARRCKGQLSTFFFVLFWGQAWRLPFRVMSFLRGGARGSYRQFFVVLF